MTLHESNHVSCNGIGATTEGDSCEIPSQNKHARFQDRNTATRKRLLTASIINKPPQEKTRARIGHRELGKLWLISYWRLLISLVSVYNRKETGRSARKVLQYLVPSK